MLLNVPVWVDEEEVKSSLTQAGVAPRESVKNGISAISPMTNPGGRGTRVARSELTSVGDGGGGHFVIEWIRVKLLDKRQMNCFNCQEKG